MLLPQIVAKAALKRQESNCSAKQCLLLEQLLPDVVELQVLLVPAHCIVLLSRACILLMASCTLSSERREGSSTVVSASQSAMAGLSLI